jgi:hypothetical protein
VADTFESISTLIERGEVDAARDALRGSSKEPWAAVLRLKLGLREGGLSVEAAMQRLVQLMRADPDLRGARELYQQASGTSYRDHVSSPSHSHPRLPAVKIPAKEKD